MELYGMLLLTASVFVGAGMTFVSFGMALDYLEWTELYKEFEFEYPQLDRAFVGISLGFGGGIVQMVLGIIFMIMAVINSEWQQKLIVIICHISASLVIIASVVIAFEQSFASAIPVTHILMREFGFGLPFLIVGSVDLGFFIAFCIAYKIFG